MLRTIRGRWVMLLAVPVAALSMGGGCPQPTANPICGNSALETGEECDDGNTTAGDGCSATCQTESAGSQCGDGTVDAGEQCDDGNTTDGDGCSSTCQTEDANPVCGNGVVETDEQCDDGNTTNDDGCSSTCQNEGPPRPVPVCGNGTLEAGEGCDDGNGRGGDGCSARCQIEAGGALCGDGQVDAGEQCDDSNTVAGDGCSATCQNEQPICGNSKVETGEQCDDGNTVSADGCSATCQSEPGGPKCGDATVDTGEGCDDGNTTAGDGCSATCQNEGGGGPPPPPPPVCGNGTVESGEQCDDGNTTSGDGCNATCQTEAGGPRCGDGHVDSGEGCDDGNTVPGDGCNTFCQREPVCGNGQVELGETCDDGNTTAGDGCSATCQLEGNVVPNDACENATQISDGAQIFSTTLATTDGAPDVACNFFSNNQVNNDIWYCYTATCTGSAVISLCGSSYDTKLAVYNGCGCPAASPLACNDDGCGSGVERVESRVTVNVTSGQKYMVRVGGYIGARGDGKLTVRCGVDTCASATNDCFAANATNNPGCSDATCCQKTCALDTFCCDVAWDSFCAGEASGVCTGNFPACAAGSGSCGSAHTPVPGCDNTTCCNTVCGTDPYCCLTEWDQNCVDEAQSACFLSCTSRAGDCLTAHATPGCNLLSCCEKICPTDPFCCDTEWDADCATKANAQCP